MEKLIAGANFMHKEEDDLQHEFLESIEFYSRKNRDNFTLQEVQDSFLKARDKICHRDFPPEGSSGYYMGYHLLRTLTGLAGNLIDDGKAKREDFHELYLEFIMLMIYVGPTSSHVEYILTLSSDSDTSFKEYFQGLRGEALLRVIRALKKDYRPDPGMDWSEYLNHIEKFFRVIIGDCFSDDQYAVAHQDFLDLYMFFNHRFNDSDPELRKAMHHTAYLIDLKYHRKIFKDLQDIALLKKIFQQLSEIILAPEFPQAEDVASETKDELSSILKMISEQGLIGDMYEVIMDLALNLTIRKAGCEGTRKFFETIGYFYYHIKEEGVKDNGALFEGLIKKFIHFLHNVKDEVYLNFKFVEPVMYDCLTKAMGKSEDHVVQWIEMIKAMLRYSVPNCISAAHRAMREKDKVIKWKKYPEEIKAIFALLSNIMFPKWLTKKELKQGMKELKNLAGNLLDEAKKIGVAKLELTGSMLQFAFRCLEMRTEQSYELADTVVDRLEYNPKKDKELMMQTIQRVTAMLEDDTFNWEDVEDMDLVSSTHELVIKVLDCVKDGKTFTWEEYDEMIYLAKMCQQKMLLSTVDEPYKCVHFRVCINVRSKVANWLTTMNESHRLIPLIPGMIQILESETEEYIQTTTASIMMISNSAGNLLAPFLPKLIPFFLETEREDVLFAIWKSYEFNPAPLEKYFDDLFEHVDSGNMSVRSYMLQLLNNVAKHQPHLFTEEKVQVLMKEAKEDQAQQVQIMMILIEVARRRIALFDSIIDDLMNPDLYTWEPHSAYSIVTILQLYALDSEEKADRVITYLMKRITTSADHNEVVYSLNALRLIGFKHRPAIEKHRSAIEKFKDSTSDNDFHSASSSILDMLDGKSFDKIADELRAVQGDVADLEERVTAAEQDIADVKDDMQRHEDDLNNVKSDLSEQGQRLDQVEDTVDETGAKVQEIDSKTLSHAPFWARDVSKLLNIEADNDWRLLSLRLGYSNDDIRAWAQQADPCMAMLNEWYTTHKTKEATQAVLTSLQLLDREDAAAVVENAMKSAEAVVEDTDFEYATPPDIFISYQWGHQDEVRLLRQHLEMAGFSCWMDVGQMGGGDKLFEKIDRGIRGAKMVISCVSGKYAKSPNCNREVSLAVSVNMPIIPLLMEKMTWPPPGSMGPIFSEYLFIRFFQRVGEETTDQRYWPLPKFQELLMQLAQLGVKPDESVVQPEYKDWWIPQVEEVMVDKDRAKKQSSGGSAPAAADAEAADSPDIFISYQWGKQPQIIKLYKRLTSLGYSCWLDIMQMGGGDSLYDKIDRGLRGCKTVLSCITTKYSKSANCRREVSLADALQKPLVPLLLETVTWPPPGPMAPILTQLLYVNCTRDNVEETWTGPIFDEILAAIHQHVPSRLGEEEQQAKEEKSTIEEVGKEEVKEETKESDPSPSPPPAPPTPEENVEESEEDTRPETPDERAITPEHNINEDDGGSKPSLREEQSPAPPARKQSQSESLMSDIGHDGVNTGNMHLKSAISLQKKSACCLIL